MKNDLIKSEAGSLIASVIDRAATSNMLPEEKKIIEAALQPQICKQPGVDVQTELVKIITTAYTRAGYKMPDAQTLALYTVEFYEALIEKVPRATVPEIREAFKEGVYGSYGEFVGLNPKTFLQFVKSYLFSNSRALLIKQFEDNRAYQIEFGKTTTPDERDSHARDFTNTLFADHLKGSLITDYIPAFIYDFLEAQGLIKLSLETKQEIAATAQVYLNKLKVSPKFKGRSIGDDLTTYLQTRDEAVTIKAISKRFAVFDYFTACAKEGKTTIFPTSLIAE